MLVLPLKPCSRYDLSLALAEWLDNPDMQVSFQPSNALQFVLPKPPFSSMDCRDDLTRLQSLRNSLSDVFLKSTSHKHALEENALEDAQEYHACLLEFEKRGFPTLDDESSGIRLTWKGAWQPHALERHASLTWERACVTYNIVALLSHKVTECSVNDRDACKLAVGYCQLGASLLSVLKELVPQEDFATVDLSMSHLTFWEIWLTATAQNFIYRMVALGDTDNTKHALLAKLARSAHKLFNDALSATQDPRLQSELLEQAQEWGQYCKAASMLLAAKASFHIAVVHRLAAEWGKEIARLRESFRMLESCRDFLKTVPQDGVTAYTRRECLIILPVVEDRFKEADQDNYKIYHQEIPKQVSDIESTQVAKGNLGLPETMLMTNKPMFVGL